jgi:hypothetical protein
MPGRVIQFGGKGLFGSELAKAQSRCQTGPGGIPARPGPGGGDKASNSPTRPFPPKLYHHQMPGSNVETNGSLNSCKNLPPAIWRCARCGSSFPARPAPNPALGKKDEPLDDGGAPPCVPGHQVEMTLNIRVGYLAAKDLDRHENWSERVADLVDHFAGIVAGWEAAEGRIGLVGLGHGEWVESQDFRRPSRMQTPRLPVFRYVYRCRKLRFLHRFVYRCRKLRFLHPFVYRCRKLRFLHPFVYRCRKRSFSAFPRRRASNSPSARPEALASDTRPPISGSEPRAG